MLTASAAPALALACAPRVAPDVLLSVAYAESRWHTLAVHDNVTGEAFELEREQEAEQIASRLIAEGHNPDLGLPQINAANLSRTGLMIATAFDPCASMHAGAQVLLKAYTGGRNMVSGGNQQRGSRMVEHFFAAGFGLRGVLVARPIFGLHPSEKGRGK